MWTICTLADVPLIERSVEIFGQMSWRLEGLSVASVRSAMSQQRGELHYYKQAGVELVMSFLYNRRRRSYFLCSGMVGPITPSHALDLFVERAHWFIEEHELEALFAIRRPMDYPPIEQMYNLIPLDPRVDVTVLEKTGGMLLWKLVYRAVPVPP